MPASVGTVGEPSYRILLCMPPLLLLITAAIGEPVKVCGEFAKVAVTAAGVISNVLLPPNDRV